MINESTTSINSNQNQNQNQEQTSTSTEKFTQRLPSQTHLISIECPLRIPPNQSIEQSHSKIIEKLGGKKSLNQKLELKNPNHPIELQLGSTKLSSTLLHPIPGEWISTNNVLIKLIKKKRKFKINGIDQIEYFYKIEGIGMVSNTIRFRHMSDFQYLPNPQHPISQLTQDMKNLNPEGVLNFRFSNETEDYSTSDKIGLFPPPIFSRYMIPSLYQYKAHIGSILSEKNGKPERLINKSRYICSTPQAITFENPNVPQAALPEHIKMKRPEDEALYQKALRLFEERPVWSRLAFQNQLTITECRALRHNKHILAYTCYMFSDGVFRDLLVKFGYDPRVDPNARFYQRISIRNLDNKKLSEKFTFKLMRHPFSKQNEREEGEKEVINRKTHIFDGIELNHSVGTYQLVDIKDTLLKRLIESTKGLQSKCRIRNGWYTSNAIEQIRSILRRKFFNLLNEDPTTTTTTTTKGKKRLVDLDFMDLLEIDVGIDSVELLKKPKSVGEKKYGGKNVKFDGERGKVVLEDDEEQEDREEGGSGTWNGPNPFKSKSKIRVKARVNPGLTDDLEIQEEIEKIGSEMDLDDESQMVEGSSGMNKDGLDDDERVEMLMKQISVDDEDEDEDEDEDDEDGMYDFDDESDLTEAEEEEGIEQEENEEENSFGSEED